MAIQQIGPFKVIREVGEGAMGVVKEAEHVQTGDKVAIKIIKKANLIGKESMKKKVEREITIMRLLNHENLVKFYEVLQNAQYLFIVQEFVPNGELYEYIVKNGALSPQRAFMYFKQILAGVSYLHEHKFCHRDLKLENILMRDDDRIVIADFGMANIMSNEQQVITACGSPHYTAPEVVQGKSYDGTKADVWSCGVILYVLMAGYLPFEGNGASVVLSKVKSGVFTMPDFFDNDLKDLISKMLNMKPKKRIAIKAIQSHPWYQKHLTEAVTQPEDTNTSSDSIKDIQEDIVEQIMEMGWKDKEFIQSELTKDEKNMLTIVYNLMAERKNNPDDKSKNFDISDSIKVSGKNPITFAPKNAPDMLRNKLKKTMEDNETPQEQPNTKKKNGILSNLFKKKTGSTENEMETRRITTNKSPKDMFNELVRVCLMFKITTERTSPTTITAKLNDPAVVEFQISVSQNRDKNTEQSFTMNFKPMKGSPSAIEVVFDILKEELKL
mmetsp:Transcript_11396/g.16873  ORF Transcript_11396/g.16873 Transcript_11396/m.16873 type:complete len:498 (+) Transcript_11396:639-2132(+)